MIDRIVNYAGEKEKSKNKARGKLSVRERINKIVDNGRVIQGSFPLRIQLIFER